MRRFFVVLFLSLTVITYGQTVHTTDIEPVVSRFMSSRPDNPFPGAVVIDDITLVKGANGLPVWYAVNLQPSGWVVVAARKEAFPVLAYAFTGRYTGNHFPEAFEAWMNQYADAIASLYEDSGIRLPADEAWLPSHSFTMGREKLQPVEPFLHSTWNQGWPYNEYCPPDAASGDGHCPTGCVPTAMAQVMYYYRWPVSGTGSYTYDAGNYGVLSANFGAATYDWNSMGSALKHSSPSAATLLSHLGISCDLVYGPDGSGMYNHKAAYSLRTYFKYAPATEYVYRDSTNLRWDSLLTAHLDRRMPLYYAGWSLPNVNGHAFVCDGYQDSAFFHFNFGWGGSYDGYFNVNELFVGGNNFNLAQEVIINCYPDTVNYAYPPQCAGNEVLTLFEGSGSDGSAPMGNYLPGASCSWLIDPQTNADSVSSVVLKFHQLATGNSADIVTVYDGPTNLSPVLASFSGQNEPVTLTSSGNALFISFIAGGSQPGEGFSFSYESKLPNWCSGSKTLTESVGVLTDGSMRFSYYDNTRCIWKIQPPDAGTVTLFFDEFNTEATNDYLRVLDLGTGDLLAEYSGAYSPEALPAPITATGGKMMLLFSTNDSVRGGGFSARWETNVGIGAKVPLKGGLSVHPNPGSNFLVVDHPFDAGEVTVEVWGMTGQLALSFLSSVDGDVPLMLDASGLKPGCYQLTVSQNGHRVGCRFIRN